MEKRLSWRMLSLVLIVLGAMAWLSDAVTLQGESTVYTAVCQAGSWQGANCTGRLAAGPGFRFRALKAHREVLFWTVGSTTEPSGKFSDCLIQDGRNWRCKENADLSSTITREMVSGCPVRDSTGLALSFRQIPKWRWLLMRLGVSTGNTVADRKT